jgi:hypothetical protein
MKPKPIPQKRKIKAAVMTFLGAFKDGDHLRTEDCIKYCHKYVGRYIYGDTVLRYMRELREKDIINYTCTHKQARIIKIIPIGAPHSL